MSKQKVVVVGNGMVGHKFIDTLISSESDDFEVITFSEESRLAYDRVQLTSYLTGKTADDLSLTEEAYYQQNGINYVVNDKVIKLDTKQKQVLTASGRVESYDRLVLATGSYPFVPPIPGNDQEHCFVYRTFADLDAIQASSKVSKTGVVIGGGLLGLEAANAIKNLGLETHVVEFAPRLMAVQLEEGGGALLRRKIENMGVYVHTEKATTEIVAGETARYRMNFADGSSLETDLIVFSAGIRPQDELARNAGITLGERGGIVINNYCQTNLSDVYAIGECALWKNQIFGLVAPGYQMAKVAASHIIEGEQAIEFLGADMSTKLKLLGVDVASIGDVHGKTPDTLTYTYHDELEQVYKRLIVSADGSKIVGAVLVGDAQAYGSILQIKQNQMPLPSNPSVLILSNTVEDESSGVDALPDSAVICTCFGVTKGAIKQAVAQGCSSLVTLKETTNASSGCGGCAELAQQVLDSELANLGQAVVTEALDGQEPSEQTAEQIVEQEQLFVEVS